ncbi:MAG: 30S ribosomal protein S3 [Clostridiales bacterium]|nr:30S ribosomal protein S3 [Clostridiales bacterium]
MGQKINPTGLRVGVIRDWDSRWYADKADFGETLVGDYKIRQYLLGLLEPAGVPRIEIEREPKRVRITIHCARPGMVVGRGGAEVEKIKKTCKEMMGGKDVYISIIEIKQPDLNAKLVADNIAAQLEKRISFRRAVKQAIGRTMKLGAKGIKIQLSGRLGGAEIARQETYHEGTIPLQTIRADIDYGVTEAKTTYGRIGVKVWIYRGEILNASRRTEDRSDSAADRRNRRDRRERRNAAGGGRDGSQRRYSDRNGGRDSGRERS